MLVLSSNGIACNVPFLVHFHHELVVGEWRPGKLEHLDRAAQPLKDSWAFLNADPWWDMFCLKAMVLVNGERERGI